LRQIEEKIKRIINKYNFDNTNSKEELLEKIKVFHEELRYQNQNLIEVNESLEKAKKRYKDLFNLAPILYIKTDTEGIILEFNETTKSKITKIQKGYKLSKYIDSSSQDEYYFHFQKLANCPDEISSIFKIPTKEGLRFYKVLSKCMNDDQGDYYLLSLIDLTNEKKYKSKIEHISFHDHLTGLYNRRFFNTELKRLDTKRNFPLGIIIGDVNGLKFFNDTFGHDLGDEVLIKVADLLKNIMRSDDIVARYGGDEYCIIIKNTDILELENIIKRIKNKLKKIKVKNFNLNLALGFSIKNRESENISDIFKKAEKLMYHNKFTTKDSFHKNAHDVIMATFFEQHPREKIHSDRVMNLMSLFKDNNKFNFMSKSLLETAGELHDIGKISIDKKLLNKKGDLTAVEYKKIKAHPEIGNRILKSINTDSNLLNAVRYHHERIDGKGYPVGLKKNEIPLIARALCICDSYDAMTNDRPYKKRLTKNEAIKELRINSGQQFDKELVDYFIDKVT
jgi:diguanylate cyclase (GGDEF)-like protein